MPPDNPISPEAQPKPVEAAQKADVPVNVEQLTRERAERAQQRKAAEDADRTAEEAARQSIEDRLLMDNEELREMPDAPAAPEPLPEPTPLDPVRTETAQQDTPNAVQPQEQPTQDVQNTPAATPEQSPTPERMLQQSVEPQFVEAYNDLCSPLPAAQVEQVLLYVQGNVQRQEALLTGASKAKALFENAQPEQVKRFIDNDATLATDPQAQEFADALTALSPQEKDAVRMLYRILAIDDQQNTEQEPAQKNGYTKEQQEVIKNAALADVEGVNPASLKGPEKELKMAQLMLRHGVTVTDAGDHFDVQPPTTGWEVMINKVMGFVSYITAVMNKIGKTLNAAPNSADQSTDASTDAPAEAPVSEAAKKKVEEELKNKKPEELRKEKEATRDDLKKQLEGDNGLRTQLSVQEKAVADASAAVQTTLELLKNSDVDSEKQILMSELLAAQQTQKKAEKNVADVRQKITDQEAKLAEVEQDIRILKERPVEPQTVGSQPQNEATASTQGVDTADDFRRKMQENLKNRPAR